jgi:DNA-binding transcriptional ArsR family regulator
MAKAKFSEFSDKEIQLAELSRALSHPARIKILNILAESNVCMTGDIVAQLPLSQSTVSQHLMELKKVGLIIGEIDGPKTCYCLDPKLIESFKSLINKLFSNICNC